MAAADYRIMTDATGQRIATALEAQSIDKAAKTDLTSIIATGTTNATGATIANGTYFYLNGTLVQAKADIASGATFTSGTNYEAVTAGGLNSLNDYLANVPLFKTITVTSDANSLVSYTDIGFLYNKILSASFCDTVNGAKTFTSVSFFGLFIGYVTGTNTIGALPNRTVELNVCYKP